MIKIIIIVIAVIVILFWLIVSFLNGVTRGETEEEREFDDKAQQEYLARWNSTRYKKGV